MITNYELREQHLTSIDRPSDFSHVFKPTKAEIEKIAADYNFPSDYISGILDDDENARFEQDADGNVLLLLQFPSQEGLSVEVYPFALVLTDEGDVIFALNHTCDIDGLFEQQYARQSYRYEMIYEIMFGMAKAFNTYLLGFKHQIKQLEIDLKKSTENDQIEQIIRNQTSLIYFEAALEDNLEVYQKFMTYLQEKQQGDFADKIYDVFVEADQAQTTTKIQLKLLENLSDLFSSLVSNNLNIVMKIMTSATFIMTIPAIIAGLYGMNVKLPIEQWPYAFWIILLAAFAISWLVFRIMLKKRMF
jgi:magnesium transporter